ncbi:MAG: type II toxin-antitoxin system VapC family toxin [Alphaproteobacteria bacterium]|nr:type II toxin-antitoxin system VapC family toxin [Alphaproteobacteria bacterium]
MAKKIVCDTDVMIDYWDLSNPRHSQTKLILEDIITLDNIVLSAITKIELMLGAINKRELKKIAEKLHRFDIALINNEITSKAIALLSNHHLSHGLSIPDCLIASTAIITELELFTYNIRDFKFISELKLFKS